MPLSPYALPLLISVVRLALGALRALSLVIVIVVISTMQAFRLAMLAVQADTPAWRCTFSIDLFTYFINLLFNPFLIKLFTGKFLTAVAAGVLASVSTVYFISCFILTVYVRSLRNKGWCYTRFL